MKRTRSACLSPGTDHGFALLIVLLFIVLLTVVTIAFLERAMTARSVSNGSASTTKAGVLADSACEIIIGDLRQEIIAGSTNAGSATWPFYVPNGNGAMEPYQNGVPTPVSGSAGSIPNMVSRSVASSDTTDPYIAYSSLYTNWPPNRTAYDATTPSKVSSTTPSLNGRYVSLARWNSHYLIPLATPTTPTTSTPVSAFVAPDWVVVTRAGANSVTWSSSLSDGTTTNTNYAVGRYAYAVYNEGGLLDVNAAGYPADTTAGGPNGLSSTQVAEKGSLALADLTQLPSPATLTQTQINSLVGWRNYYSAGLTSANGSYTNFTFTPPAPSNWLTNFALNNTNAFMNVVPQAAGVTTPSDQAVLSRQQLISLAQSIGINLNALQYLGTFSRALEQPSFVPDANRPKVINAGASPAAPPAYTTADSYLGNNDGVGGDDTINPAFLKIRVTTAFTRLNGTTAVVGEPLVKTKWALSHLGLVAYNATNATVQATSATTADPDPIYDRFGLKRSSTTSPWTYNHGQNSIMTLSQVAALTGANAREPDFAELLKAAIAVGSLAKGGPDLHNNQCNYQYTIDTTVDYQVLQIMANLIDQYDTDSYPTQVQISAGAYNRVFSGIEDVPYFYRYHLFSVVDQLPSPLIANSTVKSFPAGTVGINGTTSAIEAFSAMQTGTVTSAGEATYMYIPEVWNPHDPNTRLASSTNRPAKYQVIASTQDPVAQTPQWSISAQCLPSNTSSDGQNLVPSSTYPTSTATPLTPAANYIQFSDASGTLFREPTLLWSAKDPVSAGITGPAAGTVTDANTSKVYVGIVVGKAPLQMQATVGGTNYIVQANSIGTVQSLPTGAYPQITFSLQYQDAGGNWITYDTKYPDLHGMSNPNLIVNKTDYNSPANAWQVPFANTQMAGNAAGFDPRSARFGVGTNSQLGMGTANSNYLLELPLNSASLSSEGATFSNATFGTAAMMESQRPRGDLCNNVFYSNPGMTSDPGKNTTIRWFSGVGYSASNGQAASPTEYDGLFSQNVPAINFLSKGSPQTAGAQNYYEDADGMARRAMGGYSPATGTLTVGASGVSTIGLPMATACAFPATNSASNGYGSPTAQSESRPVILDRAFRSVSDMSYAFRGSPWKNIDFFTPESGDSVLLDTFCVNEPPVTALVAGKVDLNTRQAPVLQAIVAGAYRDEWKNASTTVTYPATSPANTPPTALSPLTGTEAGNVAAKLVGITTDTAHAWRGPLLNLNGLVGRFVANPGTTSGTDFYTYSPPVVTPATTPALASSYTYAGLSAALDSTVYTGASTTTPYIQRYRESGMRPLMDAGQVRVWNLLIDVVAQTGRYPRNATGLDQFVVDGEKRLWLHVAIDRYTGQVLDKQVEVVTQ